MDRKEGGSEIEEKLWKDTHKFMRVKHARLVAALEGVLDSAGVEHKGMEAAGLAAMLYEIVEAMRLSRLYEEVAAMRREYETRAYINGKGIRLYQTSTSEADPSPPPIPAGLLSIILSVQNRIQTTKSAIALYTIKCIIYREARAIHK